MDKLGPVPSWSFEYRSFDLNVSGRAVVALSAYSAFPNLMIASNSWLSLSNQGLFVANNATVQAGGGIIADGAGYAAGSGPGAGTFVSTPIGGVGGGGGYGGCGAAGGAPPGYSAYGGSTYSSLTAPRAFGSGGGSDPTNGPVRGSAGGGVVRLSVTGALLLDGRISANGSDAASQGAGGGSGGSVWVTAGSLSGTGAISANGGAGNELGGGGGGGCVSFQYGASTFSGDISAYGGGGYAWGGAGTVYMKADSQISGPVLVDNGGNYGANTPLPYLAPSDLLIQGKAVAYPSVQPLLLSNLFLHSGGVLTCLATQTNLDVSVMGNVTIDSNSVVTVDAKGFGARLGPGAGLVSDGIGSGAGYGGHGGASSASPGGGTYGSAQQPVDRGSGGGSHAGGSEGGGAIRLTVGGALTLSGRLSASGGAGLQEGSGGGSGGSVWLTAGAVTGTGTVTADGGAGQLSNGGGGGGGRIAIYTPVNFFSGILSAAGGAGFSPGQTGSVNSASPAAPQVVSFTPTGVLTAAANNASIVFSTPMNPNPVAPPNIGLTAPGGLAVTGVTATARSPYEFLVSFPMQTSQGTYALTVGPQVLDLLGQPMSQVYTGSFTIGWATVQGTIVDTGGLPVPGVLLQPDSLVPATATDASGNYVLAVPPGGTIWVVPQKPGTTFIPSSRTYTGLTNPVANENYVAVSSMVPALTARVQTTNFSMKWYGLLGVSYQPLFSTDLVNWQPWGVDFYGTNGWLELVFPLRVGPKMFFRMRAVY